jgi:hypothetical protein
MMIGMTTGPNWTAAGTRPAGRTPLNVGALVLAIAGTVGLGLSFVLPWASKVQYSPTVDATGSTGFSGYRDYVRQYFTGPHLPLLDRLTHFYGVFGIFLAPALAVALALVGLLIRSRAASWVFLVVTIALALWAVMAVFGGKPGFVTHDLGLLLLVAAQAMLAAPSGARVFADSLSAAGYSVQQPPQYPYVQPSYGGSPSSQPPYGQAGQAPGGYPGAPASTPVHPPAGYGTGYGPDPGLAGYGQPIQPAPPAPGDGAPPAAWRN